MSRSTDPHYIRCRHCGTNIDRCRCISPYDPYQEWGPSHLEWGTCSACRVAGRRDHAALKGQRFPHIPGFSEKPSAGGRPSATAQDLFKPDGQFAARVIRVRLGPGASLTHVVPGVVTLQGAVNSHDERVVVTRVDLKASDDERIDLHLELINFSHYPVETLLTFTGVQVCTVSDDVAFLKELALRLAKDPPGAGGKFVWRLHEIARRLQALQAQSTEHEWAQTVERQRHTGGTT